MGNLLLDQLCATADYSVEEKGVINFQEGGMGNDFLTWSTLCHIGFFCRGKGGENFITHEKHSSHVLLWLSNSSVDMIRDL